MARPAKKGLDYFNLDIDFFSDLKVRKIKKTCGAESVGVLIYLLCEIYKNGYYLYADEDLYFLISEDTGVTEDQAGTVVKKALEVGFFDAEMYGSYGVLTSESIQKRYAKICTEAKRKGWELQKEYCLLPELLTEETTVNSEKEKIKGITPEETRVYSEETTVNSGFSTQRKEKKSKIPPYNPPKGIETQVFDFEFLQETIKLWNEQGLPPERRLSANWKQAELEQARLCLTSYSPDEIRNAVENYAYAKTDEGKQKLPRAEGYNYRTVFNFLEKGVPVFFDDNIAKQTFSKGGQ